MKFSRIFPIFVIAISIVVGIYLYPYLPDTLASHWGIDGQVNGYMPKFWALFIIPIISSGLYLLFLFLPKTSSYKPHFTQFDQYYYLLINIVFGFLFYIYLLTLFWHLGVRFNMVAVTSPFFSILLFFAGHLSIVSQRNWFVGVRTPWSILDDRNWKKTNKLGGNYLKIISLLNLVSLISPQVGFYLFFFPLVLMVPVIMIYSYLIHRHNL